MRAWLVTALTCAVALAFAPAALADATSSSNWAGYAVHRAGLSFHKVSATWTQPAVTCVNGQASYSAVWVGLGGFKPASNALEQIGTEVDCTASGQVASSAWVELVPAPSRTISLVVRPGDQMHASVAVMGHRVVVHLDNLTTHRSFHRTLHAASVDVSSAEWIVEAPSECIGAFACQTLPLANFGDAAFDSATAVSARGHVGSISDPRWVRTRINLTPTSPRFIVYHRSATPAGVATPSRLRTGGTAFDVTYSEVPVQGGEVYSGRVASARPGYLVHPGR